jgi:hypothetical protein
VRPGGGRHRPGVGPAVSVEHGQSPQVPLAHGHRQVQQRADRVDRGVPVRDHDALRARGRPARVVDREQVPFADLRPLEAGIGRGDGGLVVEPAGRPVLSAPVLTSSTLEGHEVAHARHLVADTVHGLQVVAVGADHGGPRVVHDVDEVLRRQPVVDRHQDGPDLRHGVEGFQLRVRVRRDRGHAVRLRHAQPLQRRGPAVAAIEELPVRQAKLAVDDRLAVSVQPARPAGEVQG